MRDRETRLYSIYFLMQRYDDHRHLHSFPTRRSSDLASERLAKRREREPPVIGERQDAEDGRFSRSEEHTSELQSLAYLVCRLLLEKKNSSLCSPPTPSSRR